MQQNMCSVSTPFFCPFTRKVRTDAKTRLFLRRIGFQFVDSPVSSFSVPSLVRPEALKHMLLADERASPQATIERSGDGQAATASDRVRVTRLGLGVSKAYARLVRHSLLPVGDLPPVKRKPPALKSASCIPPCWVDEKELAMAVNKLTSERCAHHLRVTPGSAGPIPTSDYTRRVVETKRGTEVRRLARAMVPICGTIPLATPGSLDAGRLPDDEPRRPQQLADLLTAARNNGANSDQLSALYICLTGHNVYLGGNAGTGKSFCLIKMAELLEQLGKRVVRTAMTGIAGCNIGGSTFHHALGVIVEDQQSAAASHGRRWRPRGTSASPRLKSYAGLRDMDVLIVDEVSMMNNALLMLLDKEARRSRCNAALPFGGMQVILAGDFMQLQPEAHQSLLHCDLFMKMFVHIALHEPMRQKDDAEFLASLNRLRLGDLPESISNSAQINKPAADAVRLFPTKRSAAEFNRVMLAQLEGAPQVFKSTLHIRDVSSGWCEAVTVRLVANTTDAKRSSSTSRLEAFLRSELVTKYGFLSDDIVFCTNATASTVSVMLRARAWGKQLSSSAVVKVRQALTAVLHDAKILALEQQTPVAHLPAADLQSQKEVISATDIHTSLHSRIQREFRELVLRDTLLGHKTLKVGCRVMLHKNINDQLVNGSIGTVRDFIPTSLLHDDAESPLLAPDESVSGCSAPPTIRDDTPGHGTSDQPEYKHLLPKQSRVRFFLSRAPAKVIPLVEWDHTKSVTLMPPITMPLQHLSHDGFVSCEVNLMPLVPAYAFTVHKVQGVTLSSPVLVDCTSMWSCPHLVYVAASRVRKFEHLRMINLQQHHVCVCDEALKFTMGLPNAQEVARCLAEEAGVCLPIA